MAEKELIESIERLGDFFGQTSDLANNIRILIREKYGYHGYTSYIFSFCRSLNAAERKYNDFHICFLEALTKEGAKKSG